jgi:hypothetical protein
MNLDEYMGGCFCSNLNTFMNRNDLLRSLALNVRKGC